MDGVPKGKEEVDIQKIAVSRDTSPTPVPKPWMIIIAGASLIAIAGVVLGIMIGEVSFDGGSIVTNSSQLSLVILLVQGCVAAFGLVAHYVASRSLWSQLGGAAQDQGVPLSVLDMANGRFAMLATRSFGAAGAVGAILRFATMLIFTTWLGTAIIPRVGQVHWYQAIIRVTTMADVVTSLQTGNCYRAADVKGIGLNLGSCTGNWKVGAVASLGLGRIIADGNIYDSGCAAAYTGCAQNVVAGLSPLQGITSYWTFASTSATLPTYQVNLQCQTSHTEDYRNSGPGASKEESISITSTSSSFVLNMLGLDRLGTRRSVVANCSVSLPTGHLEWQRDTSDVARCHPGQLLDQADPSTLVQQFAELVTWANGTRIGWSWAPLLGVLMSGDSDNDIAPLAQMLNGLLAGLLNHAYVDSVLRGSESSMIRVARPRVRFATGAARWLCVAGGVLVAVSALFMVVTVYRNPVRMAVDRPSNLILAQTLRLDRVQRISLNGDPEADTLVAKWREHPDDNSFACLVVDKRGNGDGYPRLRYGVSYAAKI
jgi:hypothetical protein